MTKLKQIPRNNVIVVDGGNTRAVWYHVDPYRAQIRREPGSPYLCSMFRVGKINDILVVLCINMGLN